MWLQWLHRRALAVLPQQHRRRASGPLLQQLGPRPLLVAVAVALLPVAAAAVWEPSWVAAAAAAAVATLLARRCLEC